jgi:predicted DNA binding CopG/RHH family protein
MSKAKLDKDGTQLLKAYEADEFESVLAPAQKKQIQEAAMHTFKKDKRINMRISSRDLNTIQKRALVESIPYQTLVSSILHKYVPGNLVDVTANKHSLPDAAEPRS